MQTKRKAKKGSGIIYVVKNIEPFLINFLDWAKAQGNIIGVFLVGSYAINSAKADSDVDLVIITKDSSLYLKDNLWIENFGEIEKTIDEDWGLVKTKRVFYKNDLEIEFNITNSEWIKTNPVDKGTRKVLSDGNKILLDKTGSLKAFLNLI